jgi:pimeloyl-ACP methyl ester carboxylesterase
MPQSRLTPPELADMVAGAIEELGLGPVTLVGNDTGGAVCQLVATRRPDLIDRLVLTTCDCYDVFPPKLFSYLGPLGRAPGLIPFVFAPMRLRAPRRLPIAFGWVTKRPIDRDAEDSYVLPVLRSKGGFQRRAGGRAISSVFGDLWLCVPASRRVCPENQLTARVIDQNPAFR